MSITTPVAAALPMDAAPGPAPAFRLRGLSLGYGTDPVIRDLDLDIPSGRTTVLIGANGCGKSTILRALGRQLTPLSGSIEVAGRDLDVIKPREHARSVAFLPQSPLVPEGLTVAELVARGRHPHRRWWGPGDDDEPAVAEALALTDTAGFAHRRVDELSGGQRQRVWVALVLAQATPTLLLDEPCSFLDLAHQMDILDLVRDLPLPAAHARDQRGDDSGRRTVVAVLHELTLAARVADHLVAVAEGGVVAAGPPEQVINSETLRRVFDLEADIISDPLTGHPVVLPRGRRKGTS
ncbi:ABC transporter ATP-binding protein [Dietzia psychralcaliphila]|uniref:ABC transporter n=1 Tax=Dietzia psychralcaliphila TaxID=139021 RepID=A0AAD0NMG8_9ACTN|nr:ABC transporter ATP-binding protein [Dietzia psychralcaliphila]AWH95215.1 ABC transporter [Dietzia psychralcaliphila]PTM87461.1 iron complex transport system ATP-binding protein [Dietzia psychralcaliphila]